MLNDINKLYLNINKLYPNMNQRIVKYLLIGLIVSIATRYTPIIPQKNREIIIIGCSASISFAIIDMISPTIKFEDNLIKN